MLFHGYVTRRVSPPWVLPSIPQCRAHGASLEGADDDGGGRCTRSDHTTGERCQSFNGEEPGLVPSPLRARNALGNPVCGGVRRVKISAPAVRFAPVVVGDCVQVRDGMSERCVAQSLARLRPVTKPVY